MNKYEREQAIQEARNSVIGYSVAVDMTAAKALEILKHYNDTRRQGYSRTQYPGSIGDAIDFAIELIEKNISKSASG